MPNPQTWGVTVDEVSALAPHVTIKADSAEPLTNDPVFGATQPRAITNQMVERYILDVAARVDMRTIKAKAITDEATLEKIGRWAHDLTVNGAASYMVAAAFPSKAGLNDQSSLSAELWNRFQTGLTELASVIDELTAPDSVLPDVAGPTEVLGAWFQEPQIPDVPQPGTARDCPYPGSWAW